MINKIIILLFFRLSKFKNTKILEREKVDHLNSSQAGFNVFILSIGILFSRFSKQTPRFDELLALII